MLERMFLAGDFISGVGYGGSKPLKPYSMVESLFHRYTVDSLRDVRSLPLEHTTLETIYFSPGLWRCWVIWRAFGKYGAWLAIAFPALLLLGSFVMGTLWTLQSSQPGLSLYSALPVAYGTSYYAISLGVNIILTALIAFRLLVYRKTVMKTLPEDHGKEYVSVLTIVIESASLYSVFALIFLITYAINTPVNSVFLTVASFTQQIANYLIIYRLAQGRAWNRDTLVRTTTALDFQDHTIRDTGRSTFDFENANAQLSSEEERTQDNRYVSFGFSSSKSSKTAVV
ncbi:hypothetical protein C0995_015096 [Termitomyces sp. Mi166|nr:hypothetical protein C0995_015096 [Termitomyces sp. Mi166\